MYSSVLLFLNFPGWLAGCVDGKSDFNENPVVSPDFDFDLGFVNSFKKTYIVILKGK